MMTYETSSFIWKLCLTISILLLCLAGFIDAGQQNKKDGHDAYWENRIAFATDDAFINDSLLSQFIDAPESFPINDTTGEIIVGSVRRAYSADHNIGNLLTVDVIPFALFGEQSEADIPVIYVQLVFDLRIGEKQ